MVRTILIAVVILTGNVACAQCVIYDAPWCCGGPVFCAPTPVFIDSPAAVTTSAPVPEGQVQYALTKLTITNKSAQSRHFQVIYKDTTSGQQKSSAVIVAQPNETVDVIVEGRIGLADKKWNFHVKDVLTETFWPFSTPNVAVVRWLQFQELRVVLADS